MDEIWKSVVGFEGRYEVSDHGRVRSVDRVIRQANCHGGVSTRHLRGRMMRLKKQRNGYVVVALNAIENGIDNVSYLVHRLVLEAFVGKCPDGMQVRHFPDRDKSNNRLANLSWGTPKENQADRHPQGTAINGERCYLAKLSIEQVRVIRQRLAAGEKIRFVAKDFGVNEATIGHIKHGRSWGKVA